MRNRPYSLLQGKGKVYPIDLRIKGFTFLNYCADCLLTENTQHTHNTQHTTTHTEQQNSAAVSTCCGLSWASFGGGKKRFFGAIISHLPAYEIEVTSALLTRCYHHIGIGIDLSLHQRSKLQSVEG